MRSHQQTRTLRVAALFGPGNHDRDLRRFLRSGAAVTRTHEVPEDADAVLLFGGDGTVHRHLPRLIERRTPALIVPVGSGNDFARALGVRSVGDAVRAWDRFIASGGKVREIDAGVIASASQPAELYCCVGGCGLDSATNRRANTLPRWLRKRGGYVVAAMTELARWRPVRIRVEGEGRVIDESATFVAFANAPEYGDGMRIAPAAVMDDGLLDVCFVRATRKARILRFFPRIFTGAHVGMAEVEFFRTSHLRIETERPLDVYADGEFICRTPIEVSVRPRALRVIVP